MLICAHLDAQVLFVKAGNHGNGSSWDNAFGDLQQALATATPGAQIWVAQGIYLPTKTADRHASFSIPEGVVLLGGFAGEETSPEQRNWNLNRTILSGEIGSPNTDTDNSYTVVYSNGNVVVDGFIITKGNANNPVDRGDYSSSGGGWFNDGSRGNGSPNILNCLFVDNKAFYGGALYNNGRSGNCNGTLIQDCQFINNVARVDGGGIYNDGSNGVCNVVISSCTFESNQSYYGAGILNRADYGEANPLIENCTFTNNASMVRGSCIYNHREQGGICNPLLRGCRFDESNYEMVGSNVGGSTNPQEMEDAKKPKRQVIIRPTTY